MLLGGYGTFCFVKQMSREHKNGKPSPFLKETLRQSQSTTQERQKSVPIWPIIVDSPLVVTVNQKLNSTLI